MEMNVATAVFQVANMYRPKNHRLDTLPILAHLSLAGHSLSPLELIVGFYLRAALKV